MSVQPGDMDGAIIDSLCAERDRLKAELADADKIWVTNMENLRKELHTEISRLKVELELQKETCKAGFIDRDAWKARSERLAGALKAIKAGTDWYTVKEIAKAALEGEGK